MFNVHFVFTLLSAALYSPYSPFTNPVQWVESISIAFPSGASFFINYVLNQINQLILNMIMFPIELLRPIPVIYYFSLRWFTKTPRDFAELSESASILNYGFLYPMHVLIFIIVLCYSIISPLVLLPGFVYFGVAWLVYKNQLLYVYIKQSEGCGKLWKLAYNRSVIGLGIFQVIATALLSAKRGNGV